MESLLPLDDGLGGLAEPGVRTDCLMVASALGGSGGSGGSGGKSGCFAGGEMGTPSIFKRLMMSRTSNANDFVAACKSVNLASSNVSTSIKSSKS